MRILTDNKITRTTELKVSFAEESSCGRYLTGDPAAATFYHRRDVSKVVSSFTTNALQASLTEPQWVLEQDHWPDAPKSLSPNQRLLLYHQFDTPFAVCRPDAACTFKMNDRDVGLFFEIDRSTEGSKTVAEEKRLLGYQQLFHFRSYTRYFTEVKSPFVCLIWICLTEKRIKSLQGIFAGKPLANQMRFALLEPFSERCDVVCSPIFLTCDGVQRQIYCADVNQYSLRSSSPTSAR